MEKINKEHLKRLNDTDLSNYLGEWYNQPETELTDVFLNANPFEHIIIPNFLNEDYANKILEKFPNNYESWHQYCNPLEVKFALDDITKMDEDINLFFYLLSTDAMINKISKITDISGLTYDEYLHGAGLHVQPRHGRLNMHLDYEKHPFSGLQRRLNVILYLNKDWKPEWNGATELWNNDMSECIKKSDVIFNTAIIFKTNEISWHGVPEIIQCPKDVYRKTLAYYYMSPLNNPSTENKIGNDGSGFRTKATFVKRPQDKEDERINTLCKIRPHRRIEKEDMDAIWPNWDFSIY